MTSIIQKVLEAEKNGGVLGAVRLGGSAVQVLEGTLPL